MYNGYTSPPITNNPFISDASSAQARFPDISASSPSPDPSASQFTSWMQPGGSQQQQQQQFQPQMPSQYSGGIGYQPTGALGGGSGFMSPQYQLNQQIPSGSPMNGSSYGYLQGQTSPTMSYNPVQQQLQSPGYGNVAQFDPYSSVGQGWDGTSPSASSAPQQHQQQQSSSSFQNPTSSTSLTSPITPITTSRSATGGIHPREYIKVHRAEIESWDTYAWKQLLNTFDDLKQNWANRKREVDGRAQQLLMQVQYSGGYHPQMQQEAERLQALSREADINHDSVAASSFQMHEVFENYRKSGDAASKRRVREASNAALQSIPDWPSPSF